MIYRTTVTIEIGRSVSIPINLSSILTDSNVNLSYPAIIAIYVPINLDAEELTFSSSENGVDFSDMYDAAENEFSVSLKRSGIMITIDPEGFEAVKWIRFRAGSSESPVTQSTKVEFYLMLRSS